MYRLAYLDILGDFSKADKEYCRIWPYSTCQQVYL